MSNELKITDGSNFTELQTLINEAMARQNMLVAAEVEELKNDLEITKETIKENKRKSEENKALLLSEHRKKEHMYGFVSLGDLGQMFEVSIGSRTMGKLLRIVGVAQANSTRTKPYRAMIVNGFAKSRMYGTNQTYQYNPEKCIKKIDRWLTDNGKIEEFYSIDDELELQQYINELEKEMK